MAGATVRAKSTTEEVWISSHHRGLPLYCRLSTGVSGNLFIGYGAGRTTAYGRLKGELLWQTYNQ